MQNPQNTSPEELAKMFYCYRDALAPAFGLQGSEGFMSWEQILPEHRNLMVASARLVLQELAEREFAPGTGGAGLRQSA